MKNHISFLAAVMLVCTCILSGCHSTTVKNDTGSQETESAESSVKTVNTDKASGRRMDEKTGAYLLSSLTPVDYPDYIDSTDMFDSRLVPEMHAAKSVSFWSGVDSRYHTIAADTVPCSTVDELAEFLSELSEWCTLSSSLFEDGEQMYTDLDAALIKERITGYTFGTLENYVDIRICPNTGDYKYYNEVMKVRIHKYDQSKELTYHFWFASTDIRNNLGTDREPLYGMYVTFPECSIIPDSIYAPCTLVYIAYDVPLFN